MSPVLTQAAPERLKADSETESALNYAPCGAWGTQTPAAETVNCIYLQMPQLSRWITISAFLTSLQTPLQEWAENLENSLADFLKVFVHQRKGCSNLIALISELTESTCRNGVNVIANRPGILGSLPIGILRQLVPVRIAALVALCKRDNKGNIVQFA